MSGRRRGCSPQTNCLSLPWFELRFFAIRFVLAIQFQSFLHFLARECVHSFHIDCLCLVFYCIIEVSDLRIRSSQGVYCVGVLPATEFASPFSLFQCLLSVSQ